MKLICINKNFWNAFFWLVYMLILAAAQLQQQHESALTQNRKFSNTYYLAIHKNTANH